MLTQILGTMTFSDQADQAHSERMIELFMKAGHNEIDTAYVYNDGKTETLLGNLIDNRLRRKLKIASKVNPWNDEGLTPGQIKSQLNLTLSRLNTDHVDLLYLHAPDLNTPIRQTLKTCWDLYCKGQFKFFGLSNYAAWQVAEIVEICDANDWMKPVVYQGMYNALTRDVETELFGCLKNYGIKFYVYNPLAGGLLTGKYDSFEQHPGQGRFAKFEGYQDRYWKQAYFNVINEYVSTCASENINPAQAALRWLHYHSPLSGQRGDGIILGASRVQHLQTNLESADQGKLPDSIVAKLDEGWEVVRPYCMKYFRP